jgi:hypothetical protein
MSNLNTSEDLSICYRSIDGEKADEGISGGAIENQLGQIV